MSGSENYSVVGGWGNFEFKLIGPNDIGRVCQHLKDVFYRDETLFSLVGYSESLADEVNQVVKYYLNRGDNLSFYAVHKETQELAAVRLTFTRLKNAAKPNFVVNHPDHRRILDFVLPVYESVNIFEEYNVDKYADFFMTSVNPKYRQQGLSTEIYSRSLLLLKAKGFKVVESMFSSPYTRKIALKLGFEETSRFYYKDSMTSDGEKRFPTATSEQFTSIMVKVL